jgi:hypothetical protein
VASGELLPRWSPPANGNKNSIEKIKVRRFRMYQNEDRIWFSQTIQTHKDKLYGTQGYLRVAISTYTTDHKNFNPPTLSIMISNNHQKNISLSGENALDLAQSLNEAIKAFQGERIEIVKKFTADKQFVIDLFNHEGKELVKITILSNSTDFTVVIVPLFPTFILFGKTVKEFANNYFSLCQEVFSKTFDSYHKEVIMQIPSLIKGMGTSTPMPIEQDNVKIEEEEIKETKATIEDLDEFLGDDMENIKVPEIDEHKIEEKENKVNYTEVSSPFVTSVLKDDLYTFENMISGMSVSHSPILDFYKRLMDPDNSLPEKFEPLIGISEDDMKSICYISRFTFLMFQKNYVANSTPIPQGFSPLRYKAENYDDTHIELAYDLLLFGGFFRVLRTKLESKIPNAIENKSILHMAYRCFIDPFTFSFLDKINKEQLISIVLNRFRCYQDRGVFEKYRGTCMSFGIEEINETDIRSFVEGLAEMIFNNGGVPVINQLHKNGYDSGNLRLPAQNDFILEQIINEIVPLEVEVNLNNNEVTDALIEKVKVKEDLSDEIINFFKTNRQKKKRDEDQRSNLTKFLDNEIFREQIPEKYRDEVYKHIEELGNENFNFNNVDFAYEQFGDDIIKLLYIWKPEDDNKLIKTQKRIKDLLTECKHDRSSILAKELHESSKPDSSFEEEFDVNTL